LAVNSLCVPAAAACCVLVMVAAIGCRDFPITNLQRLVEAQRLAADTLVQFTKSADAGNRAVMADTDEASAAFAREANDAADAVTKARAALAVIVRDLDYAEETRLLEEFDRRFAAYRALDNRILQLAVENTNLKAQRLSFGPAQQEADAFRDSLEVVARDVRSDRALRVQVLVADALLAVREIQVLQARHIAESDEAAMTRLEKRAADSEAAARRAIVAIAALVPPTSRPQVAQVAGALDRFIAVNGEIVTLSRRNTNVHSLALSLGEKRTLTAACEESLRALQDALAKRGFTATR